jgi:hypothetical protein
MSYDVSYTEWQINNLYSRLNISPRKDHTQQPEPEPEQETEPQQEPEMYYPILQQHKMFYSPNEVRLLSDRDMCNEFLRIKEHVFLLYCTHCNKYTTLDRWVKAIRSNCMKTGLSVNTRIPKTCDKQREACRKIYYRKKVRRLSNL